MKKLMVALATMFIVFSSSNGFAEDFFTVTVEVKHGLQGDAQANVPVFLRAARPRGPFEPVAPKPVSEWTGFTDANGKAVFSAVPAALAAEGLRLHAVTAYMGTSFESAAVAPADGLSLKVSVYEKGLDASGFVISGLRNVVEIWEGYLVFTQFYSLTNRADTVLDVSLIPGDEFQRGLPIELPGDAKGINASGPGESTIVNSTLYWKGVLNPGQTIPLQVRYSMSAKSKEFIFDQTMGYPTEKLEVVLPVQTRFAKLPRLSSVKLAAPGFEMESGKGIMGLRPDMEFIGAKRGELKAGESYKYKLEGLPFDKPIYPWVTLAAGLLFGAFILFFGHREKKRTGSAVARGILIEALKKEHQGLLDDLVVLSKELKHGAITEREFEADSFPLRSRLGLVLKKIRDLEESEK